MNQDWSHGVVDWLIDGLERPKKVNGAFKVYDNVLSL